MTEAQGRLAGKHALVTGGTSGIGRAIVQAFAEEQARVLVVARHAAKGDTLIEELGPAVSFRPLDVTDDDGWRALVEAYAEDPFDVLVSNAGGLLHAKPLADLDLDGWREELEVNLTAHFLGIRRLLPGMLDRGRGSIIVIGSMSGLRGQPDATAYQVAKAGLRMLTKSATVAYASRGVRFNTINPGFIDTTGSAGRLTPREQWFFDRIPMARLGSTRDIAAAAVYLASDGSTYVSGVDLQVDGGYEV
jgi:NAD(P)-dependent dehydrogenase (short-subunit alcohol dehydrogenase family)